MPARPTLVAAFLLPLDIAARPITARSSAPADRALSLPRRRALGADK